MTAINRLPATDEVTSSDQIAAYSSSTGSDVRINVSLLKTWFQDNLTFDTNDITQFVSQYSGPSATAFTVTLTDGDTDSGNIRLILTPAAGYATGTIKFPLRASCIDKQQIIITCSQQVAAITWDLNGSDGIVGEPSAIAAEDYLSFMYDIVLHTWYRVA